MTELNTILAELQHPDNQIRRLAVDKLTRIETKEKIPILIRLLSDSDRDENKDDFYDVELGVPSRARIALEEVGFPAVPHLLPFVKTSGKDVRWQVVVALGNIGHIDAVDALIEICQSDDDYHVRLAALDSLGQIGDWRAAPFFLDTLENSSNQIVQLQIIKQLERFKYLDALPVLERLLSTNPTEYVAKFAQLTIDRIKAYWHIQPWLEEDILVANSEVRYAQIGKKANNAVHYAQIDEKERTLSVQEETQLPEYQIGALLQLAAQHIKLDLTPAEYQAFRERYQTKSGGAYENIFDDDPTVWQYFPKGIYSRCPICGHIYIQPMDIYSLRYWLLDVTDVVYTECNPCEHFAGVKNFIHLDNKIPTEISYFDFTPEVPYVLPDYLPDTPNSCAVLHSLPIYRVESEHFVPAYLLFVVVYYSDRPRVLQRNAAKRARFDGPVSLPYAFRKDWNLIPWVKTGKLWWLDLENQHLPLVSETLSRFPYANLEGRRENFIFRNGEFRIVGGY